MAGQPPEGRPGGSNGLLLLILLLIVGAALFWAWQESPPHTPHPSSTGSPPVAPSGASFAP